MNPLKKPWGQTSEDEYGLDHSEHEQSLKVVSKGADIG